MNEPTKDDLMKAIADVLDEAIDTFDKLEKMDMEAVEDPSKAKKEAEEEENAAEMSKEEEPKEEDEEHEESESKEEEDEENKDKKDEESDEDLMNAYKSLAAKIESRGLTKSSAKTEAKPEVKAEEIKKSETKEIEELKKSFGDKVDTLTKQVESIAKAVEKISLAPASKRKGLTGAQPLYKSDTAEAMKPSYSKQEALNKLLDMKKSGDNRVSTDLITRIELGKITKRDETILSDILG